MHVVTKTLTVIGVGLALCGPCAAQTGLAGLRSGPALSSRSLQKIQAAPAFPRLSPALRTTLAKQVTGNEAVTASNEPVRYSVWNDAPPGGVTVFYGAEAVVSRAYAQMSGESQVLVRLGDAVKAKKSGMLLFECAVNLSVDKPATLGWTFWQSNKDGFVTTAVPIANDKMVFAVNLGVLIDDEIRIVAKTPGYWTFSYCDVTTLG